MLLSMKYLAIALLMTMLGLVDARLRETSRILADLCGASVEGKTYDFGELVGQQFQTTENQYSYYFSPCGLTQQECPKTQSPDEPTKGMAVQMDVANQECWVVGQFKDVTESSWSPYMNPRTAATIGVTLTTENGGTSNCPNAEERVLNVNFACPKDPNQTPLDDAWTVTNVQACV